MYYFAYLVGSWLLDMTTQTLGVEYWLEWYNWLDILAPLTVGGLVCGSVCAVLGHTMVRIIWHWDLVCWMRRRQTRYPAVASEINTPSSRHQT